MSKLLAKIRGGDFYEIRLRKSFYRKQSREGNGLQEQITRLRAEGFDELVVDEFSASTNKRPKLEELLAKLQNGDSVVVTKLDRLARSTSEGSKLISDLLNRGVSVHILNMGLLDNTPTGKLITHILLAFAEFERDMIIERTQAGKEIARTKNGFRDGRPPIDPKKKRAAAELIVNQHRSYKEVSELTGLSNSTLVRSVRALKFELLEKENS